MTIILKYYWLQIYNFWRQLGLRVQLEVVFLGIVFNSFFTNKLSSVFSQWLVRPQVTAFGLSNLLVHAIMLLVFFAAPFIYHNLIPRQKGLGILGNEPLTSGQVFTVLMIVYLKYQFLILLISLPVFTALYLTAGGWPVVYALTAFIISLLVSLLFIQRLADSAWPHTRQTAVYFMLTGFYFTCYFLIYQFTGYDLYLDLLVFTLSGWLLHKSWRNSWHSWDQLLVRARIFLERSTRKVRGVTYFSFPRFIPSGWRPLLIKEILSYLRNRKYQRLKLISLSVFILALTAIHFYFPEHYLALVSLITFVLIWEHYSHQFSEKYVKRDPPLFYRSLPVKFRYLIFSKFFSEFIFILSIIFIIFIASLCHGLEISLVSIYCGMITLISAIILYIIILMRLIFYDRPRFAGYAYHMMIFFMVMLNATYYLVGPIISILMLFYLNYISYRQFQK